MDAAYGRSLLPNSNMNNVECVAREGVNRRPVNDRGFRIERLDAIAIMQHDHYKTPRLASVPPTIYEARLENRYGIHEKLSMKNDVTRRLVTFSQGERAGIFI